MSFTMTRLMSIEVFLIPLFQRTNSQQIRLGKQSGKEVPKVMAKLLMVVIYVVLGTMATVTDRQATCAQKLVPCAPYRNNSTAKPQNYCCNPIREAVANELPCLCNLYKDPTLLAFFNVTVAEALRISRECGITTDLSACNGMCLTVYEWIGF
ncbi:hypothetical protein V6Z11_D12G250300 [Gossypium hirsutum]